MTSAIDQSARLNLSQRVQTGLTSGKCSNLRLCKLTDDCHHGHRKLFNLKHDGKHVCLIVVCEIECHDGSESFRFVIHISNDDMLLSSLDGGAIEIGEQKVASEKANSKGSARLP